MNEFKNFKITFSVEFADGYTLFSVFLVCVPFPAFTISRFKWPIPRRYYQMGINTWILLKAKLASFMETHSCIIAGTAKPEPTGKT